MQDISSHGATRFSNEKGEKIVHRIRSLVHNLDWELVNFSHRTARARKFNAAKSKLRSASNTSSNKGAHGLSRKATKTEEAKFEGHLQEEVQQTTNNKIAARRARRFGRKRSRLHGGSGGGHSPTNSPEWNKVVSRRFPGTPSVSSYQQRNYSTAQGPHGNTYRRFVNGAGILVHDNIAKKGDSYDLATGRISRASRFNHLFKDKNVHSVKSWSEVQGNPNKKVHRTKSLTPQILSLQKKFAFTHYKRLRSGGLVNSSSAAQKLKSAVGGSLAADQIASSTSKSKTMDTSINNTTAINSAVGAATLSLLSGGKRSVNSSKNMLTRQQDSMSLMQTKTLSKIYRAKVIDAYQNRRIFTVHGNYYHIRQALIRRGWLEKLTPTRFPKLQMLNEEVLLQHARHGNEYETVAISKIINHFPAFFIWQSRRDRDLYMDVHPYRNRIRRNNTMDFCTKVGLIGCAEQLQWVNQEDVADMLYPRFFRMNGSQEEQMAFIEEFRMTQCRSVLRYILKHIENPEQLVHPDTGLIPVSVPTFALARVKRQLDDYESLVSLDVDCSPMPEEEWKEFMANSYKFIWRREHLKCTHHQLAEFAKEAKPLITKLDSHRPDYKWDGYRNLWIMKPGYQSRGQGIVVRNNLNDILSWSNSYPNRRYIVQKYIENPLLIYKTKFDVRQYMVVYIRETTVQIWLYRDCYLRFSSQEYSTEDLREAIHLTNNTVQKRYKNKLTRDQRLPKHNMWSLEQFKTYLNLQRPGENIWERRIYEGFKKNLIALVLASLDETNLLENSFELYGCDFMVDEQYNPILIEINATPDMSPSTEVTKRICPMVLTDVVKVVVDLPRNSRASTGLFELVYEVNYKFKQDRNLKDALNINGKSMNISKRANTNTNFVANNTSKAHPKKTKKSVEASHNEQQQPSSKTEPKPPTHSKPKGGGTSGKATQRKSSSTLPLRNVARKLKAVTREALALRYTMPK